MAAVKAPSLSLAQVGSAVWVSEERGQVSKLVDERVEDFYFRFAEKPLEWLNARMEDIFTEDQIDIADVFKTPGKLRAKPPRVARPRNSLENRAPLSDIFSSNNRTVPKLSQNILFNEPVARFLVAEDKENHEFQQTAKTRTSEGMGKGNTEASYHDMTGSVKFVNSNTAATSPKSMTFHKPERARNSQTAAITQPKPSLSGNERTTDDTYVTAEESHIDYGAKLTANVACMDADVIYEGQINQHLAATAATAGQVAQKSTQSHISTEAIASLDTAAEYTAEKFELPHSDSGNMFDDISPPIPVIRKSSLTFACLPAREPLTAMKGADSRGSRNSNLDFSRSMNGAQYSRNGPADTIGDFADSNDSFLPAEPYPGPAKAEEKTSTQRLQERLALLGKSNATRPSKSVNLNSITYDMSNQGSGSLPSQKKSLKSASSATDDNEDDWIGPITAKESLDMQQDLPNLVDQRENFVTSTAKTANLMMDNATVTLPSKDPAKDTTLSSRTVYEPENIDSRTLPGTFPASDIARTESTTPVGSPVIKRNLDGPLSASKARFYSVLQSAKGIFASSAGTSAQAKIEVLPPPSSSQRIDTLPLPQKGSRMQEGVVLGNQSSENSKNPRIESAETAPTNGSDQLGILAKPCKPSMGLEISKDKPVNQREHATEVPAKPSEEEPMFAEQLSAKGPLPPPKDPQRSGAAQKQNEARRPMKVGKDIPQKTKPAPVSIRVASQRIGQVIPSNAMLAASLQDSLPGPIPAKQQMIVKKSSNTSLHTSSSMQSLKSSVSSSSSRPKALEVAARKKELDEKEAQRKAEQKRDLERRRAAKQEEERKQAQEQKATEQQRALDAKMAAQKQVADQKKTELMRKNEEQIIQGAAISSQAAKDHDASQVERSQPQLKASKGELGMARPLSRLQPSHENSRPPIPHVNPAKPPKRALQSDAEDVRTQAPFTQNPAKRRRSSNDDNSDGPARPTMAPPIRLSAMRKEATGKQALGYTNAPSYSGQSIHRSTVLAQHQAQHPKTPHANDFTKSANSRIVFAEAPNPPQTAVTQQNQQPSRLQGPKTINAVQPKSSPQYPNGDSIELPEIATDSEESDDENGDFVAPPWADSPALRELLRRQQLVDPAIVFGPIAPLMMEEVFKGSKDRHARFRARTSSANWNGPDRLTEDERRRDREAREQLEREGGWTFRGSA